MIIYNVTDDRFKRYGKVISNVDFSGLIEAMEETPLPDGVEYVPGHPKLEALPVMKELTVKTYGELPIQIGYCNGHNCMLNALEYHRSSEINVGATDAVLMVGAQQDIEEDGTYDTSLVEAFLLPKGTAVEVYATTLHYAPCGLNDNGFKVAIVLPKGTNLPLKEKHEGTKDGKVISEDSLMTAANKWLIGHAEGGLDEGSFIGLKGKNLNINE